MNDITAPENFVIGSFAEPFVGYFDGGGNTIAVEISLPDQWHVGLFAYISSIGRRSSGGVQHLTVTGSVEGDQFTGLLAGNNSGTVLGVRAIGVVNGGSSVGGLTGGNDGAIQDSFADGTVTGGGSVGGLVGYNGGRITASAAYSAVTSRGSGVGGLVGSNSGNISDSFAGGFVAGHWSWAGGLVGLNNRGTVQNSYSASAVQGRFDAGGIVGVNRGRVSSSVAANSNIDGLRISTGRIQGDAEERANLRGNFASSATLINDRPISEISWGAASRGGQHGQTVTEEDLATEAFWRDTMSWDFVNVWMWDSTRNLPALRNVSGAQNSVIQS